MNRKVIARLFATMFILQTQTMACMPLSANTGQKPTQSENSVPESSLKEELEAMAARSRAKTPAETAEIMNNALENLKKSGIIQNALKEGNSAPDFSLPNATGKTVVLKDLLLKGPVVVTFYRGGWCPYCNVTLHALQGSLPQIKEAGATLLAISPQVPDESLSTVEKDQLTFEVLSDVGNETARKFGIVYQLPPDLISLYKKFGIDLSKSNGNDKNELPLAATFVIDSSGKIRYAFLDADYKKRMEPADIVLAVKNIKAKKT